MSSQSTPWVRIADTAQLVATSTGQGEHPTYPHTVAHFRMAVAKTVLGRANAQQSLAHCERSIDQLLAVLPAGSHQRPRLLLMRSLITWICGTAPTPDDVYTIADATVEALSQGVNRFVVPTLLFLLTRCYLEVKDSDRLMQLRESYPDLWTDLPDTTEKRLLDQGVQDLQIGGAVSARWCTAARAMITQFLCSDDPEELPLDSMLHYLRIIVLTTAPARSAASVLRDLA